MATGSVLSISAAPEESPPASARIPSKVLNQDDFLKLVVAQMTNQDPLNPRQDTDFIAQMATFTALEQSKAMQADIARLQANSLVGNDVEVADERGEVFHGPVTGVRVERGVPKIVIDGESFGLNQVVSVTRGPDPGVQVASDQRFLQASGLLGRTVELQVDKEMLRTGVVTGVSVEAGMPKLIVDGGSYHLSQVRSISGAAIPTTKPQE